MQTEQLQALQNLEPNCLKLGDRDQAVSNLQLALTGLNYYNGHISGEFDQNTEAALKAFQSHFGLESDGIFGQETWYAMVFWSQEEEFAGFTNIFSGTISSIKRLFRPAVQAH
ncbi:peptidoglycan-binding protein [filamentous cyanobacterium LEGE 11480]|uniref:Peptidoglycan-binding protein n=1 Tax=Romeriopsis navalis LEGE 11480 TaxID=2777977 RepID=A0A928Z4E0_9CYAN|nr:peptidoglycan-binding domain-containing protein [Romeriopsis navalis]MBE9032506.1 peptidoglycan-binding protein [Romeriopsis navalis LEGE 11480]